MSLVSTHAHVILTRDPSSPATPIGSAIPTSLLFALDLLNDPDLPNELGKPLFAWAMEYFRAHPEEHTPSNIHVLTGHAHAHPEWTDDVTLSTLTMLTALS